MQHRAIRQLFSFAAALALMGACLAEEDAAELESVTREVGSGSGGGSDITCDDTYSNGNFKKGACHPDCVEVAARYTLWRTVYNVAHSFRLGHHQGLHLLGYRYRYDSRFDWDAPGAPLPPWRRANGALWHLGDGTSAAQQLEMRRKNPGGEYYDVATHYSIEDAGLDEHAFSNANVVSDSRMCSAPTVLVDRNLYNHGRTTASEVPDDSDDSEYSQTGLIPMSAERAIFRYGVAPENDGYGANNQLIIDTTTCVEKITDGYCDSVCGNCSYVLPSFPVDSFEGEDVTVYGQKNRFTLNEVAGHSTQYVGRHRASYSYFESYWEDGSLEQSEAPQGEVSDPFTHCIDPREAAHQSQGELSEFAQLGMQLAGYQGDPRMITGLYGHNSNTDAAAGIAHFAACDYAPSIYKAQSAHVDAFCGMCGEPETPAPNPTQAPCIRYTNTAEGRYESPTFDELWNDIDVDDPYIGRGPIAPSAAMPAPQCRMNGAGVYGM
jgi:hypothetical protein